MREQWRQVHRCVERAAVPDAANTNKHSCRLRVGGACIEGEAVECSRFCFKGRVGGARRR
jgi:hypothetical protein